jgi:hypothetical protein
MAALWAAFLVVATEILSIFADRFMLSSTLTVSPSILNIRSVA